MSCARIISKVKVTVCIGFIETCLCPAHTFVLHSGISELYDIKHCNALITWVLRDIKSNCVRSEIPLVGHHQHSLPHPLIQKPHVCMFVTLIVTQHRQRRIIEMTVHVCIILSLHPSICLSVWLSILDLVSIPPHISFIRFI